MVEIVSACSWASESASLPSGASMVSISSMFMSMAPIRILRAKIVSLAAGWSCAAAGPASTAMASAARTPADTPLNRKCNRIAPSLFKQVYSRLKPILERSLFEAGLFLVADVGGERFAGRKHLKLSHQTALLVGVTQRIEHDLDLIARLDHVAAPPADPHQISGAGGFHQPFGGRFVGVERTVEGHGDMRIDPAQFDHASLHRHGLGEIEHGGRMV